MVRNSVVIVQKFNLLSAEPFFAFALKARGGSRGKKCPILIFQYVIELEKMNKMQITGG